MSSHATTTTLERHQLDPRRLFSSGTAIPETFWSSLSQDEKVSSVCRERERTIGNLKAWDVGGPVKEYWEETLFSHVEEIKTRCLQKTRGNSPRPVLEAYMRGTSVTECIPYLVITCWNKKFAISLSKAIKNNSLFATSGFRCFAWQGCVKPAVYRGGIATKSATKPHTGAVGRSIKVSSRDGTFSAATIGGIVQIDGRLFGLTVAHTFLDSPPVLEGEDPNVYEPYFEFEDDDTSIDFASVGFSALHGYNQDPGRHGSSSEFEEDLSTFWRTKSHGDYAVPPRDSKSSSSNIQTSLPRMNDSAAMPVQPSRTLFGGDIFSCAKNDAASEEKIGSFQDMPQCVKFADGVVELPYASLDLDWALVTLKSQLMSEANLFLSIEDRQMWVTNKPKDFYSESELKDLQTDPCILKNGKAAPVVSSGVKSLITLNDSCTPVRAYTIDGEYESGVSGTWIVDGRSGSAVGIVVAYLSKLNQTYFIPMQDVLSDIEKKWLGWVHFPLPELPLWRPLQDLNDERRENYPAQWQSDPPLSHGSETSSEYSSSRLWHSRSTAPPSYHSAKSLLRNETLPQDSTIPPNKSVGGVGFASPPWPQVLSKWQWD